MRTRKTRNCSRSSVFPAADGNVVVNDVDVVVEHVAVAMTTVLPELLPHFDIHLRDDVVDRGWRVSALDNRLLARDIMAS